MPFSVNEIALPQLVAQRTQSVERPRLHGPERELQPVRHLRLREPGKKEELGIKLEPRTLKADVKIGPKSARWPGEPLQVTVKLFDHRGKPITDPLKTKPHVFVNVKQVEPTWTHSGNTYSAKISPASGAGPWVVRVEVSDDFGDQVGRDFIELGGEKTASLD